MDLFEDRDDRRKSKKDRDREIQMAMVKNMNKIEENNDDFFEAIDWGSIDIAAGDADRWKDFPAVKKDFYIESESTKNLTNTEISEWRAKNFDIDAKQIFKNESDRKNEVESIPKPCLSFEDAFKHYPEILDTIKKQKFTTPSPIQSQFWPCVLSGLDTIGIAQTGTGKTLAFLLPMFIHIDGQKTTRKDRKGPTALILSPTRELAIQIEQEIKKYTYKGIKCTCVYGGADSRSQIKAVQAGAEIVVATPGRFNDLVAQEIMTS